MAIEKMKLIDLTGDIKKLDEALTYFIDFQGFHPVESDKIVGTVHGLTSYNTSNPCQELLNEIIEIENDFGLELKPVKIRKMVDSIDAMHDYIVESHKVLKIEVDKMRDIEGKLNDYRTAINQITNIESLDVSLDDLFQAKYISVRFGKLPKDSVERIKYYRNKPFIFIELEEKEHDVYCMYLMANEYEREIDNIMVSIFFERIYIPGFVHGTPETAKQALLEEVKKLEESLAEHKKHVFELSNCYIERLAEIKGELEYLTLLYETKKYVVGLGSRFLISGFIEKKNVSKFEEHFKNVETVEVAVRPSGSDQRLTPPTKLKNNWFTKPFEMFVEMYGVPSYKEIDPTLFVAITYTLLFGIMFGDVGQGLAISLIGFILTKWKKAVLGPILTRIGISAAFFGLIFGSVFGNETWLHSLYHGWGITFLPFAVMDKSNTMNLLISTIVLGVVLILIAMLINIYTKLKHKNYGEGLFSASGVAGFLFYATLLSGLGLKLMNIVDIFNIGTILILIILPIIAIFFKEPLERLLHKEKMFPTGFGGFFIEGFFELFEVILSYVTNTMSFLRIGGFILSHAGMMLVVNKLSNDGANIVVAVLGNLFVMGLEGLIVGIQVLRLEFYEMFSRYYEGNGIEFKPL